MKDLPIGRHDFRALREADLLYVDKTPVICRLMGGGMRWFLSRPRRFGKSLLVTTLRELFLGNRELFKGLWIEDQIEWKAYPVVSLLFDKISSRETEMAELLSDQLQEVAEQYGFSLQSTGIKRRTSELIQKLAGDTGVAILIDEYDKPILDVVADDPALAQKRREVLKEFFETLKSEDRHIHFIFIAGVSRFSRMSVFSGMNNLLDITLDEQFATICGYTQAELESNFADAFPAVAKRHQWTEAYLLQQVKEWYNGYQWRGEAVYNPWSVLNMAHNGRISNYWFASGHPEFLMRTLKKGLRFQLARIRVPAISLDNFELENMDYRSLLFQTGYLTVVEEDINTQTFTLGYPNREVEESLLQYMLADYSQIQQADSGLTALQLRDALMAGDLQKSMAIINGLFAHIPHEIFLNQYEAYFHSIIHICFTLLGFYVKSEPSTAKGRADAVVSLPGRVYIFEFKINGTAEEALAQIKNRDYAGAYQATGKQLVLVGVALSPEDKGITDWKTEYIA